MCNSGDTVAVCSGSFIKEFLSLSCEKFGQLAGE